MNITIEIVYIHLDLSLHKDVIELSLGSTIEDALQKSAIYKAYPELHQFSTGIFGKQRPRDTVLKQADRIEIYRPLQLNPMDNRRQRASYAKKNAS